MRLPSVDTSTVISDSGVDPADEKSCDESIAEADKNGSFSQI
jgi:hypothetical protein